jgi:SAM-dependent methyltransferase
MNSTPWLIGNLQQGPDELVVGGWALPPRGDFGGATFTIEDRLPDEVRVGLPTPLLQRVFFFFPNSAVSGFVLKAKLTESELASRHLRLSFVNKHTLDAFFHWHDIYVPAPTVQYAEPEPERILRTSGTKDFWKYKLTGYTVATQIDKLTRTYFQRGFARFGTVLDWGSGCGRLTQSFLHIDASADIVGVDIDGDNVKWCEENIRASRFQHCKLMPPLDLDAGSVGLVVGISVITHQRDEVQRAWFAELARVLRPRGVAILSFNGEFTMAKVSEGQLLGTLKGGLDDSQRDENLAGLIDDDDYYRSTLQTRGQLRRQATEHFEVIDIVPAGCGSVQDFAVLQRR